MPINSGQNNTSNTKPKFLVSRNFLVFMLCLLLSFSFWGLKILSKNYTTLISYPVRYLNLPTDKVVMNRLPSDVTIAITEQGFNLLLNKYHPIKDTIEINTKNLMEKKSKKKTAYYISLRNQFDKISQQLSEEGKVNEILADTIFFEFEKMESKVLPIKLNIDFTLAKNCVLAGKYDIVPSAIKVRAPKSILDTLTKIETPPLYYKDLNREVTKYISLKSNNKNIHYLPSSILLKIPVEQLVEKTIVVPIKTKKSTQNVTIQCLVPGKLSSALNENDFTIKASESKRLETATGVQSIKAYSKNKEVKILNVSPQKMDFSN